MLRSELEPFIFDNEYDELATDMGMCIEEVENSGCQLHKKISGNSIYSFLKKMFFIDRDYYPTCIKSEEMFETPCYAIENYYTTKMFRCRNERTFS